MMPELCGTRSIELLLITHGVKFCPKTRPDSGQAGLVTGEIARIATTPQLLTSTVPCGKDVHAEKLRTAIITAGGINAVEDFVVFISAHASNVH
jgi:hypothetical protein